MSSRDGVISTFIANYVGCCITKNVFSCNDRSLHFAGKNLFGLNPSNAHSKTESSEYWLSSCDSTV